MRSLAQRSAEAAKQIKQLIGDSVDKVRAGSDLVSRSGEQLRQIVESVHRVNSVVEEIASTNSQQATGITQLNDAVGQLDQITQQNAAGTEEIAAASKMMYEQSERLAATVAYFSVRAGKMTVPVAPPRRSVPVEMNEPDYKARYGSDASYLTSAGN